MFFAIDGSTGNVSVRSPIDYDAGYHTLSLTVWVEDRGGNTDHLDITVNIEDVNDNAPTCTPYVHVAIPENANSDSVVASLVCADGDAGATMWCNIVSGDPSSQFITSGMLVTTDGSLDYETTSLYTLTVHVYDDHNVSARHTAFVTIVVQVEDVDDNAPVWVTLEQTIPVSEAVVPGSPFFTVLAADPDTTPGSTVTYIITGGAGMGNFKVGSLTGELSALVALDYDGTVDSYDLELIASDGLHNTSSLNLTLSVLDVNDNVPEFQGTPYTFSVMENASFSTSVGTVTANDSDGGQNGEFMFSLDVFLQGAPSHFTIDQNSGVVRTTGGLDRESQDVYVALVKAIDKGQPRQTGTATIVIHVTDINDNYPVFSATTYRGSVMEQQVNPSVLTVSATDRDIGNHSRITYSLNSLHSGHSSHFFINSSTGTILLNTTVDREEDPTITLYVLAVDGGTPAFTSTATVIIDVEDVNEPPQWMTTANVSIAEGLPVGVHVATIAAVDEDFGIGGTVLYRITDISARVFSMKSQAGKSSRYILTASARDGGTPSHNASTPAVIRVDTLDLNDVAVTCRLSIDEAAFEANSAVFIPNIASIVKISYPSAVVKVWCVETRSGSAVIPTSSRRKLLQSTSPVDVHVYAVADNTTDDVDNINKSKTCLTSAQLSQCLASDPSGTPVGELTSGAMKYFHIEAVTSYHLVVTPWAETTAGIAIITVSVLLGVVLISVTVVVICYAYKRRKRPVSPQRPSHVSSYRRQDKKPSKAFDIGYLKKHPPPALMSLPPPTYTVKPLPMKTAEEGITSIDYTNKGGRGRVINRDFRSTAGDEATGRVYNYDTRTNQRRWMKTPEGKPVRVTHH
ncbi:protocadherin Fat 4-like isoform X3 [Haliotis rubra]|uniref:protocadherin Fat 4-like isoform X3 n=1 Tax=Haliotis rubra TaxID=36100 RepID=UPI001EE54B72|nr:protocadherin Fat 4-like isoform X3 [Haliotis rubra]